MYDELNQHLEDEGIDFKLPDPANTQLYSLAESSSVNEKWEQYVPDDTTILHTSNQQAVDKASYLALGSMQKQLEGMQSCHLDTLLEEVNNQETKDMLQDIETLKKSLLEDCDAIDIIKQTTGIIKSLAEHDTSLSFLHASFVDLLALYEEKSLSDESIIHLFCIYLGVLKGSLVLADLKHPFLDSVKESLQLGSVKRFGEFLKQVSQHQAALAYLSETQASDHALSSNLNFECFSFLQSHSHQNKIVKKEEGSASLYDEDKELIHFMHFQRAIEFIKDVFNKQNLAIFKDEMRSEAHLLAKLDDELKQEADQLGLQSFLVIYEIY